MSKVKFFYVAMLCCGLIACRKKELPIPANPSVSTPKPAPTKGSIDILLKNVVGKELLKLDTNVSYNLTNGDKFSVSTYNYYLSNFVFIDQNGNRFAEPESYHLAIASNPESLKFTIQNVPFGNYKSVEFLIGVDSIRNFSGAQTGALDPIYGMIWSWSTGYIMAKMEGFSPQSTAGNKMLSFHIAGFKGEYNTIQQVKILLPVEAKVNAGITPSIKLQSDLATWFSSFTFPGFSKLHSIGVEGVQAFNISQSYANMMSVLEVEHH